VDGFENITRGGIRCYLPEYHTAIRPLRQHMKLRPAKRKRQS